MSRTRFPWSRLAFVCIGFLLVAGVAGVAVYRTWQSFEAERQRLAALELLRAIDTLTEAVHEHRAASVAFRLGFEAPKQEKAFMAARERIDEQIRELGGVIAAKGNALRVTDAWEEVPPAWEEVRAFHLIGKPGDTDLQIALASNARHVALLSRLRQLANRAAVQSGLRSAPDATRQALTAALVEAIPAQTEAVARAQALALAATSLKKVDDDLRSGLAEAMGRLRTAREQARENMQSVALLDRAAAYDLEAPSTVNIVASQAALDFIDRNLMRGDKVSVAPDVALAETSKALAAAVPLQNAIMDVEQTRTITAYARARWIFLATATGGGLALLTVLIMPFFVGGLRPAGAAARQPGLEHIHEKLCEIIDGNLMVEAEMATPGDEGTVHAFNAMVVQLRQVMRSTQHAAIQVSGTANDLQSYSRTLADSAQTQSRQIGTGSTALGEITTAARHISENVALSHAASAEALDGANVTANEVQKLIESSTRGQDSLKSSRPKVQAVYEGVREVQQLAALIDDMGDRSRALALNAGLQANMMPNDTGRGFAVIADEIERTAKRGTDLVRKMLDQVDSIKSDIRETAKGVEAGGRELALTLVSAKRIAQAAATVSAASTRAGETSSSATAATRQQDKAIELLADSLRVVFEAGQRTVSDTRSMTAAASNAQRWADELSGLVSVYRVHGAPEAPRLDEQPELDNGQTAPPESPVEDYQEAGNLAQRGYAPVLNDK